MLPNDMKERYKSPIGRNATWATAQVVISSLILFAVYSFAVRAVGVVQIGLLSIISATAGVARLSELGLSGAVTRFIPAHLARGEQKEAAQVFVTACAALAIISGLFSLLAWPILIATLPLVLEKSFLVEARSIVPVTLLSLWVGVVSGCAAMSLDGINRADRRAQLTIISQFVFAFVSITGVNWLGILAIPIAQIVQAILVLVLAVAALERDLPDIKTVRPSIECFRRIWTYGAHLQIIALLVLFYDPATRLLLNQFGTLDVVGYYDLANRLVSQVRSLIVSANQVMVPHYARINVTNPETVETVAKNNFQMLVMASGPVFSLLAISSYLVSEIWLGRIDKVFIEMCLILIAGYFVNSLSVGIYFMNLGIGAAINNIISWIAITIVNSIGGLIFGSIFGVRGVIYSVALGLICGSVAIFVTFFRTTNLRLGSLLSNDTLKCAVAGLLLFSAPTIVNINGSFEGTGIIASVAFIISGVLFWTLFIVAEARFAGQSLIDWSRKRMSSFQLK